MRRTQHATTMRQALPAVSALAPARRLRCALWAASALALSVPTASPAAAATAGGSTATTSTSATTSTYQARPVCAPPAPGRASCLSLELVPRAATAPLRARSPLARPLAAPGAPARPLAAPAPPARPQAAPARAPSASAAPTQTPGFAAGQTPEPVSPEALRSAYGLPSEPVNGSAPQTIALVDAYNDLSAETDLGVYDKAFNLAACTAASGCFAKVNEHGKSATEGASGNPFPKSTTELQEREAACKKSNQSACTEVEEAAGWAVEISTDVDVAHSICPSCHILLVEANSPSYEDLETAEETAVALGATEISNSWGGPEPGLDSSAFDHPGTVITASAGDDGYLNWTAAGKGGYFAGAGYPASSPHVVAVGGTELTLTKAHARKSETVWNEDPSIEGGNQGAGGGGCSTQFAAPEWQSKVPDWASVGCGTGAEAKRAVADIAADADPYSGVFVYDSGESKEYLLVIGGTSVASPIVASVFALAGGAHGVAYPAQTLYSHLGSSALYDVAEGGNGKCDNLYTGGCSGSMLSSLDCGQGLLICNAGPGYDGPTGVGSPNGIAAFEPESEAEHAKKLEEEQHAAEEKLAKEKLAEEKRAEEKLAAEEKRKAEEALEEEAKAAAARKTEEERLAAEKLKKEEEARGIPGGGAGGKAGGAGGGQGAGAGSGTGTGGNGTSSGGGTGSKSSPISPANIGGRAASAVRLSHLTLTARAIAVIARRVPTLSQVAFAFTLTAPTHVRAVLSRRTLLHGHMRWVATTRTLTLAAAGGRNHAHLRGTHSLAPGRYRLTLTPAHGTRRSLVFVVR